MLALPFALAAFTATASAQFDASLVRVEVNQAMQTGPNSTPLAAQRSTFVRAQVRLTNAPMLPLPLDGIMRVFVDGVEAPESPIYSSNGPYPAPAISTLTTEDGTLNFVWQPPVSNDVVIQVTVNQFGPNYVPEPDLSNNTLATPSLAFTVQKRAEMAYAPVDYRPNGGAVPMLPDLALIAPGSGDNFLQAIYATHDWFYHRIDAPSKLWTSSLSGSGTALLNALNVDIAMMSPVPDGLYAWIPGGLPYNGVAFLNQPVSLGNTQTFKFQRTFAHEVGHNVGLSHNSFLIGIPGVDVEEHLAITEAQPLVMPTNRNDIMVPGLNTDQAWVREATYSYFFNHPIFDTGPAPIVEQPSILVNGTWNRNTGEVLVDNVLNLPKGRPSAPVTPSETEFVVRAYAQGTLVHELPIIAGGGAEDCTDACEDDLALEGEEEEHQHADSAFEGSGLVAFAAILPQGNVPVDRITIDPAGTTEAASVQLVRTPTAPQVAFTAPTNTTIVDDQITVSWAGSDADGDALKYYLRYSPDGSRMVPLSSGVATTSYAANFREMPAFVDGQGFFEIFASDGLNTTTLRTPVLWGANNIWAAGGGNAPWVEVMSPDDGKSFPKAATVILHSSGWDLEDRGLTGASIEWSSDVDGPLGTGRLNSSATLSLGTHVITVKATDSGGQMATASATITITDRELPDTGEGTAYCTAKLSSAGCLGQIGSTGLASASSGPFDIDASGINNNKNGLLFYGYGSSALPFLGGTLCVQSPLRRTAVQNSGGNPPPDDCSGSFTFDMGGYLQSGVDTNLTVGSDAFAQYWFRDPADAFAAGLSNALSFSILP